MMRCSHGACTHMLRVAACRERVQWLPCNMITVTAGCTCGKPSCVKLTLPVCVCVGGARTVLFDRFAEVVGGFFAFLQAWIHVGTANVEERCGVAEAEHALPNPAQGTNHPRTSSKPL